MPYKEIIDEYELQRTEDGITGRRVYIQDPSGPVANLPVVGESLMIDVDDATIAGCKCRSLNSVYRDGIPHHVANYSTRDSVVEFSGSRISKDSQYRRFEGSAESVAIGDVASNYFYWDGTTDIPIQALSKQIFAGQFSIPVSNLSESEKNTFLSTVATLAGTINDAAYEGFREGAVKFDHISGGSYYDEGGNLRFAYDLVFSYRLINDDFAAITADDFLYVFDQSSGTWKKPFVRGSSPPEYLYKKASFTAFNPYV